MRRPSFTLRLGLVCFVMLFSLALSSTIAVAQTASHTRDPQKNFVPAGAFSLTDFESINTTNGNLILRYALGQLPPGRSAMRGGYYLQYNSKLYETFIDQVADTTGQLSLQNLLGESYESGWQIRSRYELSILNRNQEVNGGYHINDSFSCNIESNDLATYIWKVKMRFPDGSEHLFRPSGYSDARGDGYFNVDTNGVVRVYGCSVPPTSQGCSCTYTQSTDPNPKMTYYSSDGSYLRLTIERNQDWTLYYPDGSKVVDQGALQRVSDRNGNYYDIAYNGITDNFGRSTTRSYDAATGDDLITQTGVGNTPLVWRIKWKTVSIVNKSYRTTPLGTQQGPFSLQQWSYDYRVVDKIISPTQLGNLSYTFNYNTATGWAEVSSITLPAAASETPPQVAYQYAYLGNLSGEVMKCTDILRSHPLSKTLTWQSQVDGTTSPVTEIWAYNIGKTVTTITGPDGGVTTELHGDTTARAVDSGIVKRIERPDGTKTETLYGVNVGPWGGSSTLSERNVFPKTVFTSIKNAAGNYSKTAIKDSTYDKNGNLLQVAEYDWVDYNLIPKDAAGLPTGIPGGTTPKRVTINTYNNATPDSSTPGNHVNAYWNVVPSTGYSTLVLNAIASKEIRPTATGTVQARSEFTYDNAATTANLIETRSWDSTKGALNASPPYLTAGNSVAVTNQYGTYPTGTTGKLIRTYDANNVATSYTYGDIGNGTTDLYVTKTIAAEGTTIARTAENKYDFHTGAVTETKDTDNNVITKTMLDVFARPTLVQEAWGTALERQTVMEYDDTLRRVITRSDKDFTGDAKFISVQHYDQLGRVRLTRKLENGVANDAKDETKGVKVQTRYFAGDSNGASAANPNSYVLVSNPYRTATSALASTEYTMGWGRQKTDQGGRLIEAQTFGGATPPAPFSTNTNGTGTVSTSYDGERTLVKDQAGKKRISEVDGLGRMTTVWEVTPTEANVTEPVTFPSEATVTAGYKTTYAYDTLDSLATVNQREGTAGVLQTRSFSYSSLKRLLAATNPESGVTNYSYDNNGNLLTKTDARAIISTYQYDALNRNTQVTYSDGTPTVQRFYDGPTYGKGRFYYDIVQGANGNHTSIDAYDALGRPLTQRRHFVTPTGPITWLGLNWTVAYTHQQTYNLAGQVKTQTYPSGRAVVNTYNNAGQLSDFVGTLGDGTTRNYARFITYNPAGQLMQERFGTTTTLYHNRHYNDRLQLYDVRLGTGTNDGQGQEWTWNRGAIRIMFGSNWAHGNGGVSNNGNITRMDHFVPTNEAANTFSVSLDYYQYDDLNRITGIWENKQTDTMGETTTNLKQLYLYDRFGNRRVDNANSNFPGVFNAAFNVDKTKNQLQAPNGTISYDLAGNQTNDNYSGAGARTYDANNKLVTAAMSGGGTATYRYDANGNRVVKTVGSTTTWYLYGLGGELVAEYPANGTLGMPQIEYGYRGGELLIEGGCDAVRWRVTDHLGSTRMSVGLAGTLASMKRTDYLPFGEEIGAGVGVRTTGQGYSQADCWRQKFTGYEKDTETGLDYAQARMYANMQGRFTSGDPFDVVMMIHEGGNGESQQRFAIYLSRPQNWNRYHYSLNNPIKFTDPSGEDVYVIFYTQGNSEADLEIWRAAETKANETIKDLKAKGTYGKSDTVLLMAVSSESDFKGTINGAGFKEAQNCFGPVAEFTLISHGNERLGPTFPSGNGDTSTVLDKSDIQSLNIRWSNNATATFIGCNTASWAGLFAKTQKVTTYGSEYDMAPSLDKIKYKNPHNFVNPESVIRNYPIYWVAPGGWYGTQWAWRALGGTRVTFAGKPLKKYPK